MKIKIKIAFGFYFIGCLISVSHYANLSFFKDSSSHEKTVSVPDRDSKILVSLSEIEIQK